MNELMIVILVSFLNFSIEMREKKVKRKEGEMERRAERKRECQKSRIFLTEREGRIRELGVFLKEKEKERGKEGYENCRILLRKIGRQNYKKSIMFFRERMKGRIQEV